MNSIIENHTHRVMTGASVQALWDQPLRRGLQMQNNGANNLFYSWGKPAVADNSCFILPPGQVLTLDISVAKSALHLCGTAGDTVAILELCGAN